jgi:hypothetical protein
VQPVHFLVAAPASVDAGAPFQVTVTALDSANQVVTGFADAVRVTSSDTAAAVPSFPFTLTNGTTSFTANLRTAGTRTVTVTDSTSALIKGVATVPVSAVHFLVAAPAGVDAGAPFQVAVTALDPANQVVTGFVDAVRVTSSDTAAAVPSFPFTLTNGTTSFTANLRTVGARTVTVTDSTSASIKGLATVPVLAVHLQVTAPAGVDAGAPFQVTVTALDSADQVVTGFADAVRATSSDTAAALPSFPFTLTNGTTSFTANLRTAGSKTVTVTDSTSALIKGIATVPVSAVHFLVAAPASVDAGAPFQVTVTALDPANQVVTGYADAVRATSSDTAAALPSFPFTLTNGTTSFTANLRSAGARTVTLTDSTSASITGTTTVPVP